MKENLICPIYDDYHEYIDEIKMKVKLLEMLVKIVSTCALKKFGMYL